MGTKEKLKKKFNKEDSFLKFNETNTASALNNSQPRLTEAETLDVPTANSKSPKNHPSSFTGRLGGVFNRRIHLKKSDVDSDASAKQQNPAQTTEAVQMNPEFAVPLNATSVAETSQISTQLSNRELVVVETYPLNPPHAFATIAKDITKGNITYIVKEPKLDETDRAILKRLKSILNEILDLKPADMKSKKLAGDYLLKKSDEILDTYGFKIDPKKRKDLLYYIVRDNLGFGKIDPLMHDPLIEDISCDGVNVPMYIWHRKYESIPTNLRFQTAEELDSFALRLAYMCGSHVSIAQPMLDACLPGGSRINLTFGAEITRRGSTFTIRKFKLDPFTVTDLVTFGTLSKEMAAYLWFAVENRVSILVAGGIAAGKTTLLNCLSMFIKPDLKVVSIEDTPELNLPHENWIPAATRTHFGLATESADVTLFDLLKASLRQRPDYIIVGEIRGAEAYTLFQAVSTGHLGMSTLHAESVESAVYRMESAPMNIPRTLIAGIDIILVQKRVEVKGKPVRKTVAASEIVGLDPRSGEILTNEVYKWDALEDTFQYTGRSYILERIAEKKGLSTEEAETEIQRRANVIEWMCSKNIRNYKDVSNVIRAYSENPTAFMKEVIKNE